MQRLARDALREMAQIEGESLTDIVESGSVGASTLHQIRETVALIIDA